MFREILLKNSIDIGDFGLSATDQLFIEVKNHFYNYDIYNVYDEKKFLLVPSSCTFLLVKKSKSTIFILSTTMC